MAVIAANLASLARIEKTRLTEGLLSLPQVRAQVERVTRHAYELHEPMLDEGLEALDAVDVAAAVDELIALVVDVLAPGVADVDQVVAPQPSE